MGATAAPTAWSRAWCSDAGTVSSVQSLATAAQAIHLPAAIASSRFSRYSLLRFDQPLQEVMGLRRNDTAQALQVSLDASKVGWPDEMRSVLPKAVGGRANAAELARFGQLWQDRVRRIFAQADELQLIRISDWQAPAGAA